MSGDDASETGGPEIDDPELTAERDRARHARGSLLGMRDEVRDTAVSLGDAVGDKVTNAALVAARRQRLATFTAADETAPPFFGRLDFTPDAPVVPGQRLYLGRRLIREAAGDDPLVIDWRATVARPFYRARPDEPLGVAARRRFGFAGPELTAYEDERIDGAFDLTAPLGPETAPDGGSALGAASAGSLLEREIQRPRSGPMRDIVATIQPEQDDIVRADLSVSVCVQGAPGTGKTAVGLHRAAYLLYAYRERLRRAGVLVVGPSRAFLAYIAAVLPTLGELTVVERDVATLVDGIAVTGTEPPEVARLKGDPRMATVISQVLAGAARDRCDPVTVTTSVGRWTVGEDELTELLAAVRAGPARHGTGRELFARRIAGAVRRQAEQSGHYFTDGTLATMARGRAIQAAVSTVWPKIDPVELVHRLLTDQDLLAAAADGVLDADEQRLLAAGPDSARPARRPAGPVAWTGRPPRRRAGWTLADAFLIDEARDQVEAVAGYGHLIVDEAQDLSAMQCRAIGRRAADGSLTVLGDQAQATSPWAVGSWPATLVAMGKPDARLEPLTRSHRVPAEMLTFANRLLDAIAPGLPSAYSDRAAPGEPRLVSTDIAGLLPATVAAARRALDAAGSLAIIAADPMIGHVSVALRDGLGAVAGLDLVELDSGTTPGRANLVPASLVKGLEFDHVVLVEPAAVVAAAATRIYGLRTLYVALTRAVSALTVVHTAPLPAELAIPADALAPAG